MTSQISPRRAIQKDALDSDTANVTLPNIII